LVGEAKQRSRADINAEQGPSPIVAVALASPTGSASIVVGTAAADTAAPRPFPDNATDDDDVEGAREPLLAPLTEAPPVITVENRLIGRTETETDGGTEAKAKSESPALALVLVLYLLPSRYDPNTFLDSEFSWLPLPLLGALPHADTDADADDSRLQLPICIWATAPPGEYINESPPAVLRPINRRRPRLM